MNNSRKSYNWIIWILLFLLNIGAAVTLNLSARETSLNVVDLTETTGWITITPNYGGTYFYNDEVGLVEKQPAQVEKVSILNRISNIPSWLVLQIAIGAIGITLVTLKHPQPLGFRHRVNIAFGFLMAAWINLAIAAIRLNQEAGNNVPEGYVRIAYPQGQNPSGIPLNESVYLLAIGIGISIFLAYLWIRWDRANRPEESFL